MPKAFSDIMIINLSVDKKGDQPLYKQLYEGLRQAILRGTIRAGERLPPTRRLSADLGISRNVVSLAFEQLILEGYLTGKVGSGTFVSATLPDDFIKVENAYAGSRRINNTPKKLKEVDVLSRNTTREAIIPFQNAVPAVDIFPFGIWSKIASREYKAIRNHHLGYDDAFGYSPLRESIASYLRSSRGVNCEAGQILIVNGAQQALSLCSHILLSRGDSVLVEDPGYPGAKAAFRSYGARVVPAPVEDDGVDISFVFKRNQNVKLVYLTPAHQYPLGGTLALSKRMELIKWVTNSDAWIIEDDYDSELRYEGRPMASLQGLDQSGRVIYIGTFSKVLFPGLRVAYIVLPTLSMAERFKSVKAVFDRQLPLMEQVITTAFMDEGHFGRHLRKMRIEYQERQKALIRAIEQELNGKIRVNHQPAGMHLIGWLQEKYNDQQVSAELAKHGVVANPLSEYTLKFHRGPALLLGYTAFNKFKIRHFVQKINRVLK